MNHHYRADIDGLRALAVLSVVIFHLNPAYLPGGFLGVDIFFVISGFLITSILVREVKAGAFTFRDFYARRIKRLFPAVVVVMATVLTFGYFALLPDEYRILGRHAFSSLGFYQNFRLMGEAGYFDQASFTKPLMHLWSLSIEEQFYLLWPLCVLLGLKSRIPFRGLIYAGLVISFGCMMYLSGHHAETLYFHPLARFWELLLGAAVAVSGTQFHPTHSWVKHTLTTLALAAICVSFTVFTKSATHPSPWLLIPLLSVALLLRMPPESASHRLLSLKPLVWVGLISYPLYLWHWPLLSYLRIIESGNPKPLFLWLAVGVSFVLAWATYRWVECPIRHLNSKVQTISGLLGAMLSLLGVALIITQTQGLPNRRSLDQFNQYLLQTVRYPKQDETCLKRFQENEAPFYCREMFAGDKMIAVIGDSHAHASYIGIAEIANQHGYGSLVLSNSGCPPFLNTENGKTEREIEACNRVKMRILETVSNDPRIKQVLIISRGPMYIEGAGFGPVEANDRSTPMGQSFFEGLYLSTEFLEKKGKKISYLLQVPELGFNPKSSCLGRPLVLTEPHACTVEKTVVAERMSSYRNGVYKLLDRSPNLTVIDIQPLLCDENQCKAIIDNKLLYADDDHLSVDGSRFIAESVVEALKLDK